MCCACDGVRMVCACIPVTTTDRPMPDGVNARAHPHITWSDISPRNKCRQAIHITVGIYADEGAGNVIVRINPFKIDIHVARTRATLNGLIISNPLVGPFVLSLYSIHSECVVFYSSVVC